MKQKKIVLPPPVLKSSFSVEQTIAARRSIRSFDASRAIDDARLGQLLWAAQGLTQGTLRASPSAGGLYPLCLYSVSRDCTGAYVPEQHALALISDQDNRARLVKACNDQHCVAQAPLLLIITALPHPVLTRYGDRGVQYVYIEAGHVAQNIHLQAIALGLGSVPVGAFDDDEVKDILDLSKQEPLYIIPVGYSTK